jgi:hypothetical protein
MSNLDAIQRAGDLMQGASALLAAVSAAAMVGRELSPAELDALEAEAAARVADFRRRIADVAARQAGGTMPPAAG